MAATGLVTISVPKDYGYVVLTASSTFFLAFWHAMRIGPYRRAVDIPYPHAYFPYDPAATAKSTPAEAELEKKKYLFNCSQRAQANFVESYTSVLAALLLGGLQYPIVSSGFGVLYVVSRILFAVGYTDPSAEKGKGRLRGIGHYIAQFGLYITAGIVGWNMVRV